VRLCHQGLPAVELLGQVLALVRRVVPFDASFWSTTDPATLLPTGGLVHNLPLAACQPYFDNELLVPDVNKFVELASAARPVGVLSQATAGDLRRSARYRTFEDLFGLGDELRVAFVADGWCWGVAALLRQRAAFAAREADFVADLAAHLAQGLRTALLDTAAQGGHGAPGTVLMDAHGQVEAVTPEAERWMAELTALTDRTGFCVPGAGNRPDRPDAVPVAPYRARLPQGAARQGRRGQPRRAGRAAVRRPLPRPADRDGDRHAGSSLSDTTPPAHGQPLPMSWPATWPNGSTAQSTTGCR